MKLDDRHHSRENGNPSLGTLYVVATPIGNLQDITLRALEVLKSVDLIAAEDTRHTQKLLSHFGLRKPLESCFEHNEKEKVDHFLSQLAAGQSIALVTNAGTPTISDPGYRLIRAAHEQGIRVVPIPGASASLAALSVSGLPTDHFTFLGFPPEKPGPRRRFFESWRDHSHTMILYVSPWKAEKTVQDALAVFGNREATLARELTKVHEEVRLATLGALALEATRWKGEVVLVIAGKPRR